MRGVVKKDLEGEFICDCAKTVSILITCLDLIVLTDNDTRWNSTYLSITRGLKFRIKITAYSIDNRDKLGVDFLEESDWKVL
jgi:hypothetical protein